MSLKLAELLVGIVLIFCGGALLSCKKVCERFLRRFLRSKAANMVVFTLASAWFLGHILTLSESDFGEYKCFFFIFFLAIILITLIKIRDFLSVRGAAILAILISNELLQAAYMQPYQSRLILVTFVYVMIVSGMIFGGWPYKGRDFIDFLFFRPVHSRLFGLLSSGYGILVLTTLFW